MSCLFQSANECDGKHTDKQNYYYFQACETKMTQGGSQKIVRMRVKGAHRKKGWVRVSHWDPAQWWHWPCRWRTRTAAALPPGCGAGLRVSEQTQSINTAFLLHKKKTPQQYSLSASKKQQQQYSLSASPPEQTQMHQYSLSASPQTCINVFVNKHTIPPFTLSLSRRRSFLCENQT